MAWIGIELNLIGFLPLAIGGLPNKKASMLYFVAQRLGSLLILFGSLVCMGVVGILTVLGLVLKLGLVPVHFWVPPVVGRLGRAGLVALLTWQKLAPLSLLAYVLVSPELLAAANAGVGSLLLLGARELRLVLVFSGLVQIAWVLRLSGGSYTAYYLRIYFAAV